MLIIPERKKDEKLEEDCHARAKRRAELNRQIQSAAEARQEATQVLQSFLEIDPDIFSAGESDTLEDIDDSELFADIMAPAAPAAVAFDVQNENDDAYVQFTVPSQKRT